MGVREQEVPRGRLWSLLSQVMALVAVTKYGTPGHKQGTEGDGADLGTTSVRESEVPIPPAVPVPCGSSAPSVLSIGLKFEPSLLKPPQHVSRVGKTPKYKPPGSWPLGPSSPQGRRATCTNGSNAGSDLSKSELYCF